MNGRGGIMEWDEIGGGRCVWIGCVGFVKGQEGMGVGVWVWVDG